MINTYFEYITESTDNIKIRFKDSYTYRKIIATLDGLDVAEFKVDIEDIGEEKFNIIGYIHDLELSETLRGQGLAKNIFIQMFNYTKKKWGYSEFELDVKENNLPAIALYKRLGFINTGRDADNDIKMKKVL